ncbi:DUF3710 domain-containing protein [Microbacterium sp. PRF11]|jgi:hypothetical protein|uniref:DUF3710 domain-containing protein n=1 Tax=Microbacterium sp. PRF11 TaxID=2962593 RepID=UPI0025EE2E02|nr:DUF3710 domain-containing protein [Microbacterium sp. PRF11]MDT0118170.1 DUF3710 domain-containing protein [Microbacterium sp. PRF11]
MTDDASQTTPETDEADEAAVVAAPPAKSAPADRDTTGPFDEAEANPVRPYIDLGGIKILPREGLNLRLEVEEQTQRIVAVGLDYADSTLQVQPFAAPRTSGLWEETRDQIRQQVKQQGGRVEEREGPLGPELLAEVPVAGADGAGKRLARFVGVDGPRWFLRGVVGGAATSDIEAAAAVEDLFRSIVVVRGSSPMPPRDLIPLRMPSTPGTA